MRISVYRSIILPLGLLLFITLFILCYRLLNTSGYLTFSDGAKYADVARNLLQYGEYGSSFKFFSWLDPQTLKRFPFEARGILPGMPAVIYIFFSLFGIKDLSVSLASSTLFLISLFVLFLLGKRFYGKFAAILTVLLVGLNINLTDYALNGASETLIIFEIVTSVYLITLKRKFARVVAVLFLIFMYFTRFNSIAYIIPIILFWSLWEFGIKKGLARFCLVFIAGIIFDLIVLRRLEGKLFFYQILSSANSGILSIIPEQSTSDYLRTPIHEIAPLKMIVSKVIYNLYNFYKFIPQIFSPYLFAFYLLGIFIPTKTKEERLLKVFSLVLIAVSVLIYSFTIPFFRYLHPVIPVIYLVAIGTFLKLIRRLSKGIFISIIFVSFVLILSVGTVLLDSRFLADRVNRGKPPVYVQLSYILRDNTDPDEVIVTNLDTWGSWYGERKTVWFPLLPNQLTEFVDNIDSIYLTSYLIDDENYYMGEEWREIFLNPKDHTIEFIGENFEFAGEFEVSPVETYDNKPARAILLVRKQ